jgi:hypothetical protein
MFEHYESYEISEYEETSEEDDDPTRRRRGQQLFSEAVEKDWKGAYNLLIQNWQDAWKKITGIDQDGQRNPNFHDVLDFAEQGLQRGLISEDGKILPTPIAPLQENSCLRTVDNNGLRHLVYTSALRGEVSVTGEDAWWLLYYLSAAWKFLARKHFRKIQSRRLLKFLLESDAFEDLSFLDEEKILGLLAKAGHEPIGSSPPCNDLTPANHPSTLCQQPMKSSPIAWSLNSNQTLGI